jgi:hypothetical protein
LNSHAQILSLTPAFIGSPLAQAAQRKRAVAFGQGGDYPNENVCA